MASNQNLYTESAMLKNKRRHFKILNKIHEVNNVFNESNTFKDESVDKQGFHYGSTEVQECISELKLIIEETNNGSLRRQNYETRKKRYVLLPSLVMIDQKTVKKCYLENNDQELTKALKVLRRGFLGKKTIDETKEKVIKCLYKHNIMTPQE
ncbi:predicted protein [Naegleria gruberi]|uniref:Predicted protein n=1 Tax=Naegleria gruberi TaxID=5762 RepID=D2VMM5_NAEGR|nr:uncharacterized protein NAEGRDRAFT_70191 [Naegleria gruberi]EFC41760.1 predicted protein [Naegleria gruberi]|eukprot:XP_002674504.1 predicted protein [Naegleria gruberi strain NEG-M]